jgi:mannosyltransferase
MTRWARPRAVGPLLLLAVGLVLPSARTADWLHPGGGDPVRLGMLLLRVALVVLALVWLLAGRVDLAGRPPLAAAPSPELAPIPVWVVGLLLVVAVALRIPGLDRGLWYDEIDTLVSYVRQPAGVIVTTFDSQNQHLLYSILARGAVALFGESAATLRLPALLFGVASIGAYVAFARRFVGRDETLVGAALLAVSYHHVWFSQNARGYTGLLFFTLLATAAMHRLLTEARAGWGAVAGYALAMALASYTHMTAALVAVAHALVIAGFWLRGPDRRATVLLRPVAGIALAGLISLCLYAPVLPQMVRTMVVPAPSVAATPWQSPAWLVAETIRGLGRGLPGGPAVLLVGLTVVLIGVASSWRRDRPLTALMIMPGLVTAVVVVGMGHNLWPRFFFFSAGFAVLIAVRGGFATCRALLRERGPRLALVGAAVLLVASALTVPRAWKPKQDFAGAAQFVDRTRDGADAVVTVDLTTYPYERYFRRDWPAVTSLDSLEAIERGHPRTWLLYTFPVRLAAVQPGIWERLTSRYDTAAVYPGTVGGGAVVVMVTRRPQPAS